MKPTAWILLLFLTAVAHGADLSWLPGSRHHQFLTHGLFLDQQTTLVIRDSTHAWGSLGGAFAVVEVTDWASHPQLLFHATIDTSFVVVGGPLDLRAETFDVRLGAVVDIAYRPDLRFSIGYTHVSGHAADGISNLALFPPDLGREVLELRVVHDHEKSFRVGGTLSPVLSASPPVKFLAANQFAEWFPFGAKDSTTIPTFYLAGSLEEYGSQQIDLSWNIQLGIYYGSHMIPDTAPMVRIVLGWYSGDDLRLKYEQFLGTRVSFPYFGFMLHL